MNKIIFFCVCVCLKIKLVTCTLFIPIHRYSFHQIVFVFCGVTPFWYIFLSMSSHHQFTLQHCFAQNGFLNFSLYTFEMQKKKYTRKSIGTHNVKTCMYLSLFMQVPNRLLFTIFGHKRTTRYESNGAVRRNNYMLGSLMNIRKMCNAKWKKNFLHNFSCT